MTRQTRPHAPYDRSLLDAVLRAHQRLLLERCNPAAISPVLAAVGAAARVDRVYIFQFRSDQSGTIRASHRYEWLASDVTAQIDNPALQDVAMVEAGYGRWVEQFRAYRPVHGPVVQFPQSEQTMLDDQQILSLMVLPIFTDSTLWGFVGFDDCRTARVWTTAELDLLLSLAISLGAALVCAADAPGRAGDAPQASTNSRIAAYAAISGGLLWFDANPDAGSAPAEGSVSAVEARIRTLVATHRFLQSRGAVDAVPIDHFLAAMKESFRRTAEDRRIRAELPKAPEDDALVKVDILPAVGMLISELLSCVRSVDSPDGSLSRVTISTERVADGARVMVRGYDARGRQIPIDYERSMGSLLFVRRLLESIACDTGVSHDGSALVALTVPVPR